MDSFQNLFDFAESFERFARPGSGARLPRARCGRWSPPAGENRATRASTRPRGCRRNVAAQQREQVRPATFGRIARCWRSGRRREWRCVPPEKQRCAKRKPDRHPGEAEPPDQSDHAPRLAQTEMAFVENDLRARADHRGHKIELVRRDGGLVRESIALGEENHAAFAEGRSIARILGPARSSTFQSPGSTEK